MTKSQYLLAKQQIKEVENYFRFLKTKKVTLEQITDLHRILKKLSTNFQFLLYGYELKQALLLVKQYINLLNKYMIHLGVVDAETFMSMQQSSYYFICNMLRTTHAPAGKSRNRIKFNEDLFFTIRKLERTAVLELEQRNFVNSLTEHLTLEPREYMTKRKELFHRVSTNERTVFSKKMLSKLSFYDKHIFFSVLAHPPEGLTILSTAEAFIFVNHERDSKVLARGQAIIKFYVTS